MPRQRRAGAVTVAAVLVTLIALPGVVIAGAIIALWGVWVMPAPGAIGAGVAVGLLGALLLYPTIRWLLLPVINRQGCLIGIALYLVWAALALGFVWQFNFTAAFAATICAPLAIIAGAWFGSRRTDDARFTQGQRRR
ncbi:MAG: hypothetical protein WCG26_16295 [Chloroflexales bacterium]